MNNNIIKTTQLISEIKANDYISIKHNEENECVLTSGVVKKIDKTNKLLYVLNSKISFDDIVDIKKCCN